jgi:hypothetical protein
LIGYDLIKSYLTGWLTGLGYDSLPDFEPGPGDPDTVQKISAGTMVIITIGSGAGLAVEGATDRPNVQLRVIGDQGDFYSAERLAFDIDKGMNALQAQRVEGVWVVTVYRLGGGPAVLLQDDADRWHYTCNYIIEGEY